MRNWELSTLKLNTAIAFPSFILMGFCLALLVGFAVLRLAAADFDVALGQYPEVIFGVPF